tara:strand:- start:161 stop:577 length:417 start_codon:yes stop_codon:yes gene_type:complete
MEDNFTVTLLTPDSVKLEMEASEIRGINPSGVFAVQGGHTALLTNLTVASVEIIDPEGTMQQVAVTGGFIQVKDTDVIILARSAELPGEIDLERAEAAKRRAENRLGPLDKDDDIDFARAKSSLARALIRLSVAGGSA